MLFRVNMDYENCLEGSGKKSKLISPSEFEYIFFFIEAGDKKLLSRHEYSDDYLSRLENYGIQIPEIIKNDKNEQVINWWGVLSENEDELNLEKKLNSKVFSTKLAKKYDLCPEELHIIENGLSLKKYLLKFSNEDNFLIRSEYGFSGKGQMIKSKKELLSLKIFSTPKVMAPFYKRILDLGISFNLIDDTYFLVVNYINKKGQFIGGTYHENVIDLCKRYSFIDKDQTFAKIQLMMSIFKNLGVKGNIEVDMFYYEKGNLILPYYLVEINYRKTMGVMIKSLAEKWPSNYSVWLILPKKEAADVKGQITYINNQVNMNERGSVYITSPQESFFNTIYFTSSTIEGLKMSVSEYLTKLNIQKNDILDMVSSMMFHSK